jgi:hypothetical protein
MMVLDAASEDVERGIKLAKEGVEDEKLNRWVRSEERGRQLRGKREVIVVVDGRWMESNR